MINTSTSLLGIRPLSLGVMVVIITTLTSQNIFFGHFVVSAQMLCLILLVIYKNQLTLPYFIFSVGTGLEFATFVNNDESPLYNISNIKFGGMNLGIYMLFVAAASLFFSKTRSRAKFNHLSFPLVFIFLLSLVYVQGIILSIFDYSLKLTPLINFDLTHLIGIAYLQLWPYALILICFIYVIKYQNGLENLKLTIVFTLLSSLIGSLIVNLAGYRGTYGQSPYYLAPTLIFLGPLILIFLRDKVFNIKNSTALLIFLLLIAFPIIFLDFAGGKIILLSIMSLLLSMQSLSPSKIFFSLVIFLLVIATGIYITEDGQLIGSKVNEVISLINFASDNWYLLLQPSTRFRVDEFINIYEHYLRSPLNIVSGFGIVGGAPDYIGGYGLVADGSFPQSEYSNGYFISYHEFSSFLIKYGLTGVIFSSILIINSYKYRSKSPFLVVGTIWFMLFWGYSQTMAVVGAASLVVGVMEVRKRVPMDKINSRVKYS